MSTKTALVTGGNRGIGVATARQLAELGMRTLVGSRDAGRGELALDVLVNNAGILPEATALDAAAPVDADLFLRTFETNVFGAVRMIEQFVPLLLRAPAGRIVNVSTTMGSLTDQADPRSPYYGVVVPAYRASKAALNSVTIAVSKLLEGTPVKIVSVCPGWVRTDLGGPDNRKAAPLEAAEAARVVVEMACMPDEHPSGGFVDARGALPW